MLVGDKRGCSVFLNCLRNVKRRHFQHIIISKPVKQTDTWITTAFFLAALSLPLLSARAQQTKLSPNVTISTLLTDPECPVDRLPLPIGGIAALQRAIRYPDIASRVGLDGRVIARASIDTNGTATDVRLWYADAQVLGDAVIEGVSKTKFKPAIQRGHTVAATLLVPVTFSLYQQVDSCHTQPSTFTEVELDHSNAISTASQHRVILREDGTASLHGYARVEQMDTAEAGFIPVEVSPVKWFHDARGEFNPLDFERIRVLLQGLNFPDSTAAPRRFPWGIPRETITIVTLNGKRKSLVDIGENSYFWAIARAIDYIAAHIHWQETWPEPRVK